MTVAPAKTSVSLHWMLALPLGSLAQGLGVELCVRLRPAPGGELHTVLVAHPSGEVSGVPEPGMAAGRSVSLALNPVSAAISVYGDVVGTVEVLAEQGAGARAVPLGVRAAAAVVACALERIEAVRRADDLQGELERLGRRVLQSHEDVRKLVAMEVHDTLSQRLAFLYFQLQLLAEQLSGVAPEARQVFMQILSLARSLVEDTSRLLLDLRPPHLEDLGLVPALRRYLESFAQQTGITVQLAVHGNWPHLADQRAVAIYRVVQEALNNIWKHAGSRQALVSLSAEPTRLQVTIVDDGVGFDTAQTHKKQAGTGFGIDSMTERAAWCGGELRIRSQPGKGCAVELLVPMARKRMVQGRR